jgi:hypothetical protein
MKPTLPTLLSFNGGYVDTAGYLALQGLFTAHVTGNFVTLAAALIHGTSGVIAKLLALPVFCVVILLTRLVSFNLPQRGLPVLGDDADAQAAAVDHRCGARDLARPVSRR